MWTTATLLMTYGLDNPTVMTMPGYLQISTQPYYAVYVSFPFSLFSMLMLRVKVLSPTERLELTLFRYVSLFFPYVLVLASSKTKVKIMDHLQ